MDKDDTALKNRLIEKFSKNTHKEAEEARKAHELAQSAGTCQQYL
jgi:hypothetical protein